MKNLILFCFTVILVSCSQNETEKVAEKAPEVEKDPNSYIVDVSKGAVIKTDQGSIIRIPENAFVDQEGKLVNGEVAIKFEEFHDFADIAESGIPMFYDSAGVRSDLRSAGMFRIEGTQKDQPVEVAEGKKLGVDLASIEDTPCYNFYKQEENGQWNYLHTENGVKPDSLVQNTMPKNPKNQDLSNAVSIDIDYTDIPELNMYRSLIWRYVGNRIPSTMTHFSHKTAKIVPVQGEALTYELQVQKDGKMHKMKIQPILTGKDLELALSKYQNTIEIMQSDPNSIYYKPKMIRSVQIDGFGTYNWDIKNKRDQDQVSFPVLAKIDGKVPHDLHLSLISYSENIVVNYSKDSFDEFSYDPKSKNILVAFYDNNKIALLNSENFNKWRKFNGQKELVTVDFSSKKNAVSSKDELKERICEAIKS
ncbi:MAG: hypothetical protein KDC84_05185 [Crocinitomicaceae bacterium]|nr:hypothetical protein [Crocinitomicaceae bacterium]